VRTRDQAQTANLTDPEQTIMPKVLLTEPIQQVGTDILSKRTDITLEQCPPNTSEQELVRRVPEVDAILVGSTPITEPVIEAASQLKVVSRRGVGYDAIDLAALRKYRIPLTIVGSANATTVAEHSLFFILALAKQVMAYDRATRTGDWGFRTRMAGIDLLGKTLLLVGFGRVGRALAPRAAALGMRVTVYDPQVPAADLRQNNVEPVTDLLTGLAECDFVSLHVPLTPETKGLIGQEEFAVMKPSAFVISTCRGGVIDEEDLLKALQEGRIRGAGLDVFSQEPIPVTHPLLALENLIVSPHTAALTIECARRMDERAARNCLDAIDGTLDPAFIVPNE
jgi:D-3-phosphoglycerate dehydrogenase / 2-oxoglutarate reductase